MIRGVAYWFVVFCINLLFPPAAVMIVAGVGMDTLLNCLFFLLGVIPSHIHGFYITCTYFSRRRKVKRGKFPGGDKPLIYSKHVLNGGASNREVDRLYHDQVSSRTKNKI